MSAKTEPRIVQIERDHILTALELAAFRDPTRLLASRHCRRDTNGNYIARRQFKVELRGEP